MAVYKAPLKDIQFVLNEVLDVSQLARLPGYEDATPDTIHAIMEEAAKLCENVLFPLNRSGDEEGCTYENGVVHTPKGTADMHSNTQLSNAFCMNAYSTNGEIKRFQRVLNMV